MEEEEEEEAFRAYFNYSYGPLGRNGSQEKVLLLRPTSTSTTKSSSCESDMDDKHEPPSWRLHVESSDVGTNDTDDDDQISYDDLGNFLIPKLQSRKVFSKARWNGEIGMAEVIEIRGGMWGTTGIVRKGKLYCSIEETLFLAEIGALIVTDYHERTVSLKDLYEKLNHRIYGCCTWEAFEVYKHLKSLGYIVKRHGTSWSVKTEKRSISICETALRTDASSPVVDTEFLALRMVECVRLTDLEPEFDVYLPNSKFRKSSPGDPNFMLYISRGFPFTRSEFEALEKKCNGTPLKMCLVDHGRVSFFSYNRIELLALT